MTKKSRPSIPLLDTFYSAFYSDPLFKEFYNHSGYANFGYWDQGIETAEQASNRLVEKLLQMLPGRLLKNPKSKVLDVACGHGASSKYLCRYFKPRNITGIGMERAQIAAAKQRVPSARFITMDATELKFNANSFDLLVCVEAAFHFQTRKDFLHEAFRVLKPGGTLVFSDLLMGVGAPLVPPENYLSNPQEYSRLLKNSGFENITMCDATELTWRSFRRAFNRFVTTQSGQLFSPTALRDLFTINVNSSWAVRACVLACVDKP